MNLLYAVVTVYLSPCCNTAGDMNSLLHSSNLKRYMLLSCHMKWCTWHRDSSLLLVQGHSWCSLLSAKINSKKVVICLRHILILLLNFQVLFASVDKFQSLCHFLSDLVDMCCFQQNTCTHKKKSDFTQLMKWNCKYTLICNISRHCHQSYVPIHYIWYVNPVWISYH